MAREESVIAVWIPVTLVPTSLAIVTFITERSSVVMKLPGGHREQSNPGGARLTRWGFVRVADR